MSCEDLLLLVQNIGNFLMEFKEFLLFAMLHSLFHNSNIVFNLMPVFVNELGLNVLFKILLIRLIFLGLLWRCLVS